MRNEQRNGTIELIGSLMIFGTIGTISRFISFPSSVLSCARAILGVLVILIFLFLNGSRPDLSAIKRNSCRILAAGVLLGINWVFIFEGFRLTTVAIASLCYYMQPIFLLLVSPLFFRERLSAKKIICIVSAFIGMILITVSGSASFTATSWRGILFSLSAAVTYTANIIVSKKMHDIGSIDKTLAQLLVAGIIMIPYVIITTDLSFIVLSRQNLLLTLLMSLLHTGVAYLLYYNAIDKVSSQTVAILSYIDPVESVLLSCLLLGEPMTTGIVLGAVLILVSSYLGSKSNKRSS